MPAVRLTARTPNIPEVLSSAGRASVVMRNFWAAARAEPKKTNVCTAFSCAMNVVSAITVDTTAGSFDPPFRNTRTCPERPQEIDGRRPSKPVAQASFVQLEKHEVRQESWDFDRIDILPRGHAPLAALGDPISMKGHQGPGQRDFCLLRVARMLFGGAVKQLHAANSRPVHPPQAELTGASSWASHRLMWILACNRPDQVVRMDT